jgi:hypothetical protein
MNPYTTSRLEPSLQILNPVLRRAYNQHAITAILIVSFLFGTFVSCSRVPGSAGSKVQQTNKATPINSASRENGGHSQNIAAVCDQIIQIKVYPFHGDRGEDATYDAFMDAGEAAIPCLIKKITDTTIMPDPRETLKLPEITVGDVAYFLLIDITKLGFVEFMPREIQTDYKKNGVWAYHAYVAKKEHRKDLQNKLNEWYRQKYGKDGREPAGIAP